LLNRFWKLHISFSLWLFNIIYWLFLPSRFWMEFISNMFLFNVKQGYFCFFLLGSFNEFFIYTSSICYRFWITSTHSRWTRKSSDSDTKSGLYLWRGSYLIKLSALVISSKLDFNIHNTRLYFSKFDKVQKLLLTCNFTIFS